MLLIYASYSLSPRVSFSASGVDDVINFNDGLPKPVTLQDKTSNEQHQLFEELDDEDKQTVFKIVDKMLTTKKFNSFFEEHLMKK